MSKKSEEKTTEVVEKKAGLPAAMLDKLAKAKHTDDFSAGDLFLPWLQIVQTSSAYMKRGNPEYIQDAREGDIIDNLTKNLRSTQQVIFVKFERHYTTWKPGGGKLVKQWFTDRSGYDAATFPEGKDFGKKIDADGNEVVETPMYYILILDPETGAAQPATMAWGSTQAKKVRKVNALARETVFVGGNPVIPPIYSRIFDISTVIETGNDKSWGGWAFKVGGLVLAHEKFGGSWWAQAEAFRDQIEAGNVRPAPPVDQTAAGEEDLEVPRPRGQQRPQNTTDAKDLNDDIPF